MVGILRKADQRLTSEVAKKHGVSDQTIYAWRKRFGALEPADVKRRRSTSRKQSAEEDGGGSRSGDRRPQEDRARKWLAHACALLSVARSTLGTWRCDRARRAGPAGDADPRRSVHRYGYGTIRIRATG